jgi:hypothetical protein
MIDEGGGAGMTPLVAEIADELQDPTKSSEHKEALRKRVMEMPHLLTQADREAIHAMLAQSHPISAVPEYDEVTIPNFPFGGTSVWFTDEALDDPGGFLSRPVERTRITAGMHADDGPFVFLQLEIAMPESVRSGKMYIQYMPVDLPPDKFKILDDAKQRDDVVRDLKYRSVMGLLMEWVMHFAQTLGLTVIKYEDDLSRAAAKKFASDLLAENNQTADAALGSLLFQTTAPHDLRRNEARLPLAEQMKILSDIKAGGYYAGFGLSEMSVDVKDFPELADKANAYEVVRVNIAYPGEMRVLSAPFCDLAVV